ncbi:MAG TPA: TIGR04438 family Trp-rich protein [Rubrivivax sp.]|nr:TIGR04438 family Trp-rich protein [Rubrivivax sp.]
MPLVVVGVLLLLAKVADFGPFGAWSWWIILAPFGLAILWWQFADKSGWTQRKAMDKMEQRKEDRRQKAMDALGLNKRREKQVTRSQRDKARANTGADPAQREESGRSSVSPPAERRDPRA